MAEKRKIMIAQNSIKTNATSKDTEKGNGKKLEVEHKALRHFNPDLPLSNVLVPGTVIWRKLHYLDDSKLSSIKFVKTEKGSLMAKVRQLYSEFVVINHTVDGYQRPGYTVFVSGDMPENWTHIIVTGVSKKFKESTSGKGGAVFAKFAKPYDLQSYVQFRKEIYLAWSGKHSSFSELCIALDAVRPTEERNILRCLMNHQEDTYCHVQESDSRHDEILWSL